MQWLRSLVAFAALALALLGADDADARLDGGSSFARKAFEREAGSPALVSPVTTPTLVLAAIDHPVAGQPPSPGSLGGLFNRGGVIGGFAAGFLGSGVLGLLFGHGMVGELGSIASFFGLLFQLALIVMLGRLIWSWWTGRNQPAFSGLSPRQLADPYLRTRHEMAPSHDHSADNDDTSNADDKHSANA